MAIQEKLVPISTAVTILSVGLGVLLSLSDYNLKVKSETLAANSARIESDIQLVESFIRLMETANARSGYVVSEKVIDLILQKDMFEELGGERYIQQNKFADYLEDNAVLTLPNGKAQQNSAIAAIGVLGERHEILRPVAIQALRSLPDSKSAITEPLLKTLISLTNASADE